MFGNLNPFPLSDRFIQSFMQKGRQRDFLAARASATRSFEHYDFNIKALDTTNFWTVAAGSGATTWAVRAEAGGWIRGTGGTSSAVSGLQLSIPQKYFTGTSGAGFAALIRLSDISECRLTCGFADALPAVNTKIINSMATPTFNTATAGAMYMYDHQATTTTSGLYTIGTSSTAAKVATTTNRFVAATTLFVAVELNGTVARCWVGNGNGPLAATSNAVTPSDGLIPFIEYQQSDGVSSTVDVDALWHWSNRV
jgi:hypothetical protein